MFPALKTYRSILLLKTYREEQIPLVGNIHVHVKYGSQEAKLVKWSFKGMDQPCWISIGLNTLSWTGIKLLWFIRQNQSYEKSQAISIEHSFKMT